jgi:hypothetical protein
MWILMGMDNGMSFLEWIGGALFFGLAILRGLVNLYGVPKR